MLAEVAYSCGLRAGGGGVTCVADADDWNAFHVIDAAAGGDALHGGGDDLLVGGPGGLTPAAYAGTGRRTNTNPNTHNTWTHKRVPLRWLTARSSPAEPAASPGRSIGP